MTRSCLLAGLVMLGLVGVAWTDSDGADEVDTAGTQVWCSNVLLEPGFEAGPNSAWGESSSNGWPIVQTEDPLTGSYSAWLGGDHREDGDIWQAALISSEAVSATLIYWYKIDSEDYCGYDSGGLLVDGVEVPEHQFELCGVNNTAGFVQSATVDLLAYAGTAPEIRWFVSTDENLLSNLFVDDVELEVCLGDTPPDLIFGDDFESGDFSRWTTRQSF